MLRIGITGGLGSGKSTAAKYFETKGYPVTYADPIAKQIMAEDKKVREKIESILGPNAYRADGTLNTDYIAASIFSDRRKKNHVEGIVHPVVIKRISDFFDSHERKGEHPMAFVEAALIFESNMDSLLDYVIVVSAPEPTRIDRVALRDGSDKSSIRDRIRSQFSDELLRTRADFVLENTGDIDHLHRRCAFLEKVLLTIAN